MGNAQQKLGPDEVATMEGMEEVCGLDRKEILREYRKFKKTFPSGGIDKPNFQRLAESFLPPQQRTEDYINRLFNAFDADHSGEIEFREFVVAMNFATSENHDERLAFYFKTLDFQNKGYLDQQDIEDAVDLIFKHNPGLDQRVGPDINTPAKVVAKIFSEVDVNGDRRLECQELIDFMREHPKMFSYLGLNLIFLP